MKYIAWKFEKLAGNPLGKRLWEYITSDDALVRMQTATQLKRPAVEGIARELSIRFCDELNALDGSQLLRTKQMVGHMVKQIMQTHTYDIYMKNVRVLSSDLFYKGTSYRLRMLDRKLSGPDEGALVIGIAFENEKLENKIRERLSASGIEHRVIHVSPLELILSPTFAIFVDPAYVGADAYSGLLEFVFDATFQSFEYKDAAFVKEMEKYFDRDEAGRFIVGMPEVINICAYTTDEIIAMLPATDSQ